MKQQHTTHNHTKFHRQTKHFVAQPKKNTQKSIILPPSSLHNCFNQKKREKKIPQKVFPPQNGCFIFPQIFAATNGQIFRALKQAVKPSIQSWQNPTSVALNDFGANGKRAETGMDGCFGTVRKMDFFSPRMMFQEVKTHP